MRRFGLLSLAATTVLLASHCGSQKKGKASDDEQSGAGVNPTVVVPSAWDGSSDYPQNALTPVDE